MRIQTQGNGLPIFVELIQIRLYLQLYDGFRNKRKSGWSKANGFEPIKIPVSSKSIPVGTKWHNQAENGKYNPIWIDFPRIRSPFTCVH